MIDLAVVTSVWGDYSRYLPEWAESVAAQHPVKPAQVVIADLGRTDETPMDAAVAILDTAGIDTTLIRDTYRGMGAARNTAVAATTTDWVMHLDADDLLLPHALTDTVALAPSADVVSLGALRDGRSHCFPAVTREQILNRKHGCYSCSPFRRRFWEARPWHTRNDWIDSVFWVGLAHAGARFAGTDRPGFVYRQHQDSFSHRLTPQQRRLATQQWLRACRSGSPT